MVLVGVFFLILIIGFFVVGLTFERIQKHTTEKEGECQENIYLFSPNIEEDESMSYEDTVFETLDKAGIKPN